MAALISAARSRLQEMYMGMVRDALVLGSTLDAYLSFFEAKEEMHMK
jgi:hypothetical protein